MGFWAQGWVSWWDLGCCDGKGTEDPGWVWGGGLRRAGEGPGRDSGSPMILIL